jgi:hypothetical protein
MSNHLIKTPHAAVLVWNYNDRVGVPDGDFESSGIKPGNLTKVEKDVLPVIISTLSCVSIQTNKAKGRPDGSFNIVLAPYKNWTSNLTPGSWCCILMSNKTITENDLKHANKDQVKMFGRIESVSETKAADDGTRQTLYYVSGTDWGDVFNSILYVDNLIKGPNDKGNNQGDVAAIALRAILFGDSQSPKSFEVTQNLKSILQIMGTGDSLQSHTGTTQQTGRLAGSIYEFVIPDEIVRFFDFRDADGTKIMNGKSLNKFISLIAGSLVGPDSYKPSNEAQGFVDPFSLQGTHSLWQILLENSNPALNEMLCDLKWNPSGKGGVQFALYNRIKPFAYKNFKPGAGKNGALKSYFQYVKTNIIDPVEVISVNAGTNWRDKINFIEIKPQFSEFKIVSNWQKQKSQVFDPVSFKREGFRALIVDTKQFPVKPGAKISSGSDFGADWDQLLVWAQLMREWYFGTHRMLNGVITIHGTTPYIGIGENIRFDAGLINPTPNINAETAKKQVNQYILAHIESVQHSFSVDQNGARSYRTTIQFVRGIIVDKNNQLYGEGMLDQDVTKTSQHTDRNQKNNISTSDISSDPDPQKVRGT